MALAICGALAGRAEARPPDEWTIRLPEAPATWDPGSPEARHTAARALLRSGIGDIGPAEPLLAAWLASRASAISMSRDPSSGAWLAKCSEAVQVRAASGALIDMVARYGTPIVAIEPERPASPDDRKASSALQSFLAESGLRTLDGTSVRESRREIVDGAVERGLSPDLGRKALDHLDTDYLIRVESRTDATRPESVYGVEMHLAERTVTVTVMRSQVDSVVRSWRETTQRRSRSSQSAQTDAEATALSLASCSALAAIAEEWIALASGARPWILELQQPSLRVSEALATGQSMPLTILEHRPGVRAVIEVAEADIPGLDRLLGLGVPARARPGILLVAREPEPFEGQWKAIGAAAAVAGAIGTALLLRRRRHSRRMAARGT